MNEPKVPQIFIAHATEDKPRVRELYTYLKKSGFKPWLDEKDLLPGQNWREEIPSALRKSHFFIACLSSQSVNKRGYVQREFKQALDLLAEVPKDTIYLIPLKLDDCEIPDLRQNEYGISLRDIQWLNYWEDDGYEKLVMSIKHQWEKQGNYFPKSNSNSTSENINQCHSGSGDNVRGGKTVNNFYYKKSDYVSSKFNSETEFITNTNSIFDKQNLERYKERNKQLNGLIKNLSEQIAEFERSLDNAYDTEKKSSLSRLISSKKNKLESYEQEIDEIQEKIISLEKSNIRNH